MIYSEQSVAVYNDGNSVEKVFFELGSNEERQPALGKKIEQMKELMRLLRKNRTQKQEVGMEMIV